MLYLTTDDICQVEIDNWENQKLLKTVNSSIQKATANTHHMMTRYSTDYKRDILLYKDSLPTPSGGMN